MFAVSTSKPHLQLPPALLAEQAKMEDVAPALATLDAEQMLSFLQERMPTLLERLPLENLLASAREVDQHLTSAQEHARIHTPAVAHRKAFEPPQPMQGLAEDLLRAVTTLIDTFASALAFYDETEPPTSIYEKQVLITIYYRFIQLPLALAGLLSSLVFAAWKAQALAASLSLGLIGSAYIYQKWLRPFPRRLLCCELLPQKVARSYQATISGLDEECRLLMSNLAEAKPGQPTLILGPTGSGKTTLLHKLQQKIDRQDHDLPASLKGKIIVSLQAGRLAETPKQSLQDKLKQLSRQLAGFESQVILHIDELQAAGQTELLKDFLRNCGFVCVASTTQEAYKQSIVDRDADHSFARSFGHQVISMQKWNPIRLEAVLQAKAGQAWDLHFADGALAEVVKLSSENLQDLGQPAKALELLEKLIQESRKRYEPPESRDLRSCREELALLQERHACDYSLDGGRNRRVLLEKSIHEAEQVRSKKRSKLRALRKVLGRIKDLQQRCIADGLQLRDTKAPTELAQQRYLARYMLLSSVRKWARTAARQQRLEIDRDQVQKVFQDYKRLKSVLTQIDTSPFAGIIKDPQKEHFDELRAAVRMLETNGASGLGEPTATSLIRQRWSSNEAKLTPLFGNCETYQQVLCEACEQGWKN